MLLRLKGDECYVTLICRNCNFYYVHESIFMVNNIKTII